MTVMANDISEHQLITHEAIQYYNSCSKRKLSEFSRKNLIISNTEEDINLFRKWFSYSHYYSPRKDVSTWRGTSMDRILKSEEYLEGFRAQLKSSVIGVQLALSEVGHVIHHIQDSAVPTHLVPIKHWLNDAFEGYRGKKTYAFRCKDFVSTASPHQQLEASAHQTLNSLSQKFLGLKNGTSIALDWNYFWFDGGQKWGSYGYFGNNFGQTAILTSAGLYEIPVQVYEDYWNERRTQSLTRSVQILYWFFSVFTEDQKTSRVEMSDGSEVNIDQLLFEH